jgi:hypothetical protein
MPERRRFGLLLLAAVLAGCTGGLSGRSVEPAASTRTPGPTADLSPTPVSSATATAIVEPTATPAPDPALLELHATSCEGGVVLDWSPSTHPDFHHYIALRSPSREIETAWPPIAPAVDWGDSYATDPFVTSAVDASIIPSATRWNYRVMAYDAGGRAISASPVRSGHLGEVIDLGPLLAVTDGDVTRLTWERYEGFSACFSAYRVLDGSSVMRIISDPGTTIFETDLLRPGTSHQLRVEAVRSTALGSFVTARTQILGYVVPGE